MQIPPYNPIHINTYGLGCSRFARRYSGNRKDLLPDHNGTTEVVSDQKESPVYCFLFLWVLRCFTSPGAHPHTRIPSVTRRVSPFGNFRVKGYLAPHRNLSQPYHVLHRFLKPRHSPYTLCSCKERYTPLTQFARSPYLNVVHRCTFIWVRPEIQTPDYLFCLCLSGTKRPERLQNLTQFLTRQTIPVLWVSAC